MIFRFFDLALYLFPPKFVILRVLSMSEECRLSFTSPGFQFFRDPGTVSWMFFNYFSWEEGINSRSKFHHQQSELVFTRLSIKNRVLVLLGHPTSERTPCTIVHIAWLYFLDDRFVIGCNYWSGLTCALKVSMVQTNSQWISSVICLWHAKDSLEHWRSWLSSIFSPLWWIRFP